MKDFSKFEIPDLNIDSSEKQLKNFRLNVNVIKILKETAIKNNTTMTAVLEKLITDSVKSNSN